jgi:hypothetical protein
VAGGDGCIGCQVSWCLVSPAERSTPDARDFAHLGRAAWGLTAILEAEIAEMVFEPLRVRSTMKLTTVSYPERSPPGQRRVDFEPLHPSRQAVPRGPARKHDGAHSGAGNGLVPCGYPCMGRSPAPTSYSREVVVTARRRAETGTHAGVIRRAEDCARSRRNPGPRPGNPGSSRCGSTCSCCEPPASERRWCLTSRQWQQSHRRPL